MTASRGTMVRGLAVVLMGAGALLLQPQRAQARTANGDCIDCYLDSCNDVCGNYGTNLDCWSNGCGLTVNSCFTSGQPGSRCIFAGGCEVICGG